MRSSAASAARAIPPGIDRPQLDRSEHREPVDRDQMPIFRLCPFGVQRVAREVAMRSIVDVQRKSARPLKRASGVVLSIFLACATWVAPAVAEEHGHHHGGDHHRDHRDRRGGDRQGGGYYAPPVIYGSPYADPPPIVYEPGIVVQVPGISIGIR